MDGNMPSGESFIRQFLYGQLFFEEEFNKTSNIFWLPDTFGYSGQLPQIINQSEINYFITQKLSWNSVNKFPHSTFYWHGIDGSSILTHFPPAETYNSRVTVEEVVKSSENCKEPLGESLLLFGHGDGGGGPTFEQIERILKFQNIDGIPKVEIRTPTQFFERISKENLPKWKGELYLELHRGTFTSQSETKKYNRKCEFILREIEILLILTNSIKEYPQNELNRLWKLLLLFETFFFFFLNFFLEINFMMFYLEVVLKWFMKMQFYTINKLKKKLKKLNFLYFKNMKIRWLILY